MIKKIFLILLTLGIATSLYAKDTVLFKEFTINGKTELKKVKIKKRNEYTYTGNQKMKSEDGKVSELFFYDENDLLIKKWAARYSAKDGLYWYEYDKDKNLFEFRITEDYEETLYTYDEKNRLIRTATTDGNFFNNYFYDENDNIIKIENESGAVEYKYDSKNHWSQSTFLLRGSRGTELFEYDDKNRLTYYRRDHDFVTEHFYKYDDVKYSSEERIVTKNQDKIIYDLTDFYQYNSEGKLLYSKYYSGITHSTSELLYVRLEETFYEYDERGFPFHIRTVSGDKEKNEYYEFFTWDNGFVNTEIIYEEVE